MILWVISLSTNQHLFLPENISNRHKIAPSHRKACRQNFSQDCIKWEQSEFVILRRKNCVSYLLEWLWRPHESGIKNHFWESFDDIWMVNFGQIDLCTFASARGNIARRSIIANWATTTTPNTFISRTFTRNDLGEGQWSAKNQNQKYCNWYCMWGIHFSVLQCFLFFC